MKFPHLHPTTLADLTRITRMVNEMFGKNRKATDRWMRTSHVELDHATPLELMHTKSGMHTVEKLLRDHQRDMKKSLAA